MTLAQLLSVALILFGGVLAVGLRNILHAVLGLAVSLLGVAGLFFTLDAPFVGTMEVLIYVGGISVAMVFAVMLSSAIGSGPLHEGMGRRLLAGIPVAAFIGVLGAVVLTSTPNENPAQGAGAVGLDVIGRELLTTYGLVFEVLSVVLLVAIMGAIVIARREPKSEETP